MKAALSRIKGSNLVLRFIMPDDAAYVHSLRRDPTYNAYLSEVQGTVADQHAWINAYKARESVGQELYYIITKYDGTRCGTVRLYNIRDKSFTWGSWILDHNKPPKAALESAILSFGIGFDSLGSELAHIDVHCDNIRALAFYRRIGMSEVARTHQKIYLTYTRERFFSDRDGYLEILSKVSGS